MHGLILQYVGKLHYLLPIVNPHKTFVTLGEKQTNISIVRGTLMSMPLINLFGEQVEWIWLSARGGRPVVLQSTKTGSLGEATAASAEWLVLCLNLDQHRAIHT